MLSSKFFPLQINIVICQIQGIHNVDLVRPVEYRCGNIESQRLSGKAQMNFKYLSDVHTGRHTQRIQHDIQRPSVRQVRHILCRQHTGNNTLVTMTSGHLIPDGNLSLLCDIDTYCLINTRRQFIAVFSCKYFGIHDDTIFTMRHLQGSVSYFAGFLTENRTQQSLFCCQFCLSLWSYLADQNIPCTHLRTNTDDSPLIQIFQRVIADTRNISCDLFRPQLCITCLCLIFFNMHGSIHVVLHKPFAQQYGILVVVTFPGHESDQRVLSKSHLAVGSGRTVRNYLSFLHPLALVYDGSLVIAVALVTS